MGFTPEQLDAMERQSSGSSSTPKKKFTPAELDAMEAKSKPPVPQEPGFIQSLAQGIAKPFLRVASTPKVANALPILGLGAGGIRNSATKTTNYKGNDTYDYGYFGKVQPLGQKDNLWDNTKDVAGTALELGANFIPVGKAGTLAKATLAGKVGQGIKTGASVGAKSGTMYGVGSELQQDDASVGSVLGQGALGGATGALGGGVLGGALPLPVGAAKTAKSAAQPESYMRRVVNISKPNSQKFERMAGQAPEKYLVERGIYGKNEEIVSQLQERFNYSRDLADTELSKLGGTWTHPSLKAAIRELQERESKVSLPGVPSLDTTRIAQLAAKEQAEGLTMSEVNEVKRLFEKNVKTGYLRENISDKIALAKNIDSNLRNWQLETARKLGLENLDEINKETRLAYQLADSIHRKISGAPDNGGLDLLDAVLIAGGDPYSLGMFAVRKGAKSEGVQSGIARKLGGKATVGLPTAKTRAPITDKGRLLPEGNPNTSNPIYMGFPEGQVTEADRIANNVLQNSRIQRPEQLALPPMNPETPYNLGGAPIPLRPRNTIEPPAKAIRQYDRLQPRLMEQNPIPLGPRGYRNAMSETTPTTNIDNIPQNIPPSIPQILPKNNPQSGKIGMGTLSALGGLGAGGTAIGASSQTTYERPTGQQPALANQASKQTPSFDRKSFATKLVHVENRGARDRGDNLYTQKGVTGDLGKYQVSPDTLKSWSEPWLGKTYTPAEFLKDPQAQEDFFQEFLNVAERLKLTPDETAIAWHSGWGELGTGSKSTRDFRFYEKLEREMEEPGNKAYLKTFNEIK